MHQTGDKPESDGITEENGLLQKELKFEFNTVFVKLHVENYICGKIDGPIMFSQAAVNNAVAKSMPIKKWSRGN